MFVLAVSVKDSGVWQNRHYLIEELLSLSLPQLLLKTGEEGFTVFLCQKLARDALRALNHIHQSGFVHGDLKPANLMWSPAEGCLKLIDFGLSFHQDDQTVDNQQMCKYGRIACEMIQSVLVGGSPGESQLMELVSGLLKCSPTQRLTSRRALEHSFFFTVIEPTFRDLLILPTCILRLVNTVDSVDLKDESLIKDIKTDIEEECRLFGTVESCVIPCEGAGAEKVFIKYSNPDEAEKAFEKLNGRVFNDRTVITTFFCTEAFQNQQFY